MAKELAEFFAAQPAYATASTPIPAPVIGAVDQALATITVPAAQLLCLLLANRCPLTPVANRQSIQALNAVVEAAKTALSALDDPQTQPPPPPTADTAAAETSAPPQQARANAPEEGGVPQPTTTGQPRSNPTEPSSAATVTS